MLYADLLSIAFLGDEESKQSPVSDDHHVFGQKLGMACAVFCPHCSTALSGQARAPVAIRMALVLGILLTIILMMASNADRNAVTVNVEFTSDEMDTTIDVLDFGFANTTRDMWKAEVL